MEESGIKSYVALPEELFRQLGVLPKHIMPYGSSDFANPNAELSYSYGSIVEFECNILPDRNQLFEVSLRAISYHHSFYCRPQLSLRAARFNIRVCGLSCFPSLPV